MGKLIITRPIALHTTTTGEAIPKGTTRPVPFNGTTAGSETHHTYNPRKTTAGATI
jgi:hypothetical protein